MTMAKTHWTEHARTYTFLLPLYDGPQGELLAYTVFDTSEEAARTTLLNRLIEIGYGERGARRIIAEAHLRDAWTKQRPRIAQV